MNRNRHALGHAWTRGWTVDFSVVVLSMLVFRPGHLRGCGRHRFRRGPRHLHGRHLSKLAYAIRQLPSLIS